MSDLPYVYEQESTDKDALQILHELCRQFAALTVLRNECASRLESIEQKLKDVSEKQIPEAMANLKMRGLEMETGLKVVIREKVHASLPKDPVKRRKALDALRRSGNEGAIRSTFEISFGKDSYERVGAFQALLHQHNVEGHAQVSFDEGVHHSTYKKIVREVLEADPEQSLEDLGAYRKRVAEIDV